MPDFKVIIIGDGPTGMATAHCKFRGPVGAGVTMATTIIAEKYDGSVNINIGRLA